MDHVLLIDDDHGLSAMLSEYLSSEGFKITAAYNGHEGEAAISQGGFDAVILDIMLPDISGIEVLRRVRGFSSVPIIMLTAKGDDVDRVIGLEMGADDYLAKPYFPRELLARLRAILRRNFRGDQAEADHFKIGGLELSLPRREVNWNGALIELTSTEFNMLSIMMRTNKAVTTKESLSTNVLGRKHEQYDRSVDVHVGNLRRKLAAATQNQCEVETIRGIGYRLRVAE
ncbi:MAG TPA: response regulator transcription factor [Rhizomicrobium sp.]|nr:response regulator transcription factor [Rhizomicrobium sp.]